ncbi:MAG: helix-turn-helix domain-containing protein [Erysipelotrichaceae bacterium]
MTKGRKTTIEERQEIVKYCKEHDNEYKLAAEHFDVSYAQVYQWVQKYNEQGESSLEDKRGSTNQMINLVKLKTSTRKSSIETSS